MKEHSDVLMLLGNYWEIMVSAVMFTVGYTKLHFRAAQTAKDIDDARVMARRDLKDLEARHEDARIIARRDLKDLEVRQEKRRQEDTERMEKILRDMQTDIKTLIREGRGQ